MGRRDFEIDETISPPTKARIPYNVDGVKNEKVVNYIPYSRTTTRYITLNYTDSQSGEQRTADVVSSRESVTVNILAAANPVLCKSYLENGISAALSIEAWQVTNTTTTYTIGPDGPRAEQEIVDEYISEFMFSGSMGIQEYVIDDEPVVLSNNLIHASQTNTEYQINEAMGVTKTLTTRYLCWGLTQEGSQLAAALASQATAVGDITALIADMTAFVCDGTRIQNTQGRDFGVQLRPSEQDEARDRLIRGVGYPITAFELPEAKSLFNVGVKPDGFDTPEGFIPFGRGDGGAGTFYLEWGLPTVDPPLDPEPGDPWIDAETDTPNIWDGDVWTPYSPDPPEDPDVGDTWINSGTGQATMWDGDDWQPYTPTPGGYPVEAAGAVYRNGHTGILHIWSGTAWLPYLDANPTSPDPGDRYVVAATGAERSWNGTSWSNTGTTWPTYSVSPPGSPTVGTVWIDRNDHTPKRWSGTIWAPFTPVRPPDAVPGDTWTDAATGICEVWTGSEWIAYTTTPPPSPTTGQVYINPTTGIKYSRSGSAWVETGEVFGSTILSNVQPTAADSIRSTEIDLPFPNDDTVAVDIGPGGVVRRWLVPGGVREQAQSLAELENALRYGTAYGSNVVVEAWQLPTEPLKPFYVRAGGIETQFLADGASWQWDADQLVVACDGIICGATGRVPSERVVPWVPAMVDLASLPAVGAPTVTSGPVPANTIATPAGFIAARPRGIWALLPTNGTDQFEEYRDPAHLFRPFTPVEADQLTMLITISEVETPYTLVPVMEGNEDLVIILTIEDLQNEDLVILLTIEETGGGVGGGGTWTPADWSPSAWFDSGTSADFTLSGGVVDDWDSTVGTGLSVSATGSTRPAYGSATQNSLNLVTFDGVNDALISGSAVLSDYITASAATLVVVFRPREASGIGDEDAWRNAIVAGDSEGIFGIYARKLSAESNTEILFHNYDGVTDAVISQDIEADNTWVIAVLTHGSGTLTAYMNGGAASTVSSGDTDYLDFEIAFGANTGTERWLDCDIAMVLFKKASTSEADVRKIEGYAADRLAIQSVLPSGHPYKNAPP